MNLKMTISENIIIKNKIIITFKTTRLIVMKIISKMINLQKMNIK